MLPDVTLLEIFDFYVGGAWTDAWHTLVHVCQKWRNVVFGSPRRLNLQLFCTHGTPVRKTIDAWPLLPIRVEACGTKWGADSDNIIAALEHNDRIPWLDLGDFPSSQMENILVAMQQPFPALEYLHLYSRSETVVVPASFLGGSAPQLQELVLRSIPFPGLANILLSATHLVTLHLVDIPHSGYFSPEAIVTGLSALTGLGALYIEFKSLRSRPNQGRRPPPLIRTLLPALTCFEFKGVSEYLDDFVAGIDAHLLLDCLHIAFFHQLIFDTPQLTQLISRTPKFKAYDGAYVQFSDRDVSVTAMDEAFRLVISCRQPDWQLSSLAQVCGSNFIPTIEHLYIREETHSSPPWQDDIETGQWLELLHQLTSVKNLKIARGFTPRIAPTLEELVGGRATEVLPALWTLVLEETLPSGVQETIDKFVAARELAGHPIAISPWPGKD